MNIEDKDKKYIWHPYTQMQTAGRHIPIVAGKGVYLIDEGGNRYIDAVSSWWVNIHGHAHPHIAKKVSEQLQKLEHVIFAGFTHEPAVELAERLLRYLPDNQGKVFFSDNGSTAVEVAVKMAFQYWHNQNIDKKKIIAFKDAYHGDTFGAMSVSGRSTFTAPFAPFLFDVEFVETPVKGTEEEILKQLKEYLENEEVAAFIFEPLVLGAGGMLMYEANVLDEMLDLCKRHDVLTIADEVMTGFGRTGKLFATDHLNNKPDIICLSKGLTGGTMAMGLTSCTDSIYEAFLSEDKLKTFFHGHSYTANPVACAAGLASLDLVEKDDFLKNIARINQNHQDFIKDLQQQQSVENTRLQGTILAFDLKTVEHTSYHNKERDRIYNFFLERKVLLRPLGNTIYIMPPYCITDQQLKTVYQSILDFLG